MSAVERHRLNGGADYRVDVEVLVFDDGDVRIEFLNPDPNGSYYFKLSVDQLAEIVSFVEKHGQVHVYGEPVA